MGQLVSARRSGSSRFLRFADLRGNLCDCSIVLISETRSSTVQVAFARRGSRLLIHQQLPIYVSEKSVDKRFDLFDR